MALAPLAGAKAGELKALVGGSMTDSMKELGPRSRIWFSSAPSHRTARRLKPPRRSSPI
jgi:hypothetical protein